jgi:AcrR family transcriptional regulator
MTALRAPRVVLDQGGAGRAGAIGKGGVAARRGTTAAARRLTKKSERTRRRILTAAKQLFDRRGYRDTTIDDITRRAEIAHGTFYLYFGGKSELLKELLTQALEEFDRIASRDLLVPGEIAASVRQTLETYQRNRLLMRLLREASAADAHFREDYDEFFVELLVEHLRDNIIRLQSTLPKDAPRIDARAAARAMVGMIESFAYGIFIGGERYSIDLAVETLTLFCTRAVGLPT